jgi:CheY-like chemotaxis protein
MSKETKGRKAKILLVEDNPGDVELLTMALQRAGIDFEFAHLQDGGEALAFIRAAESSAIDLAILDLNLPKNDGIEVLTAMRETQAFCKVPVMVFTSSASPRERSRMESFGIACYVSKPNDLDEYMRLGGQISEVLKNSALETSASA